MLSKRTMVWPSWFAWLGGAGLLVACGGTAVIDEPIVTGGGGATTTSSSTSVTTTSSTWTTTATTTDVCEVLEKLLLERIDDAQACDPLINALQCTGATVIYDACGCEVVANDIYPDEAGLALEAYVDWWEAGCGPMDCTYCPPPPHSPWYCDPSQLRCLPAYE